MTVAEVPIERLEQEIAGMCAELSARLAHWLALVAEFDRREGAGHWGFRGTTEWLAWRCGLSRRAARDHVRVARGLRERPLVREAFAGGELSYSKVRALVRAPAGADDAALVQLARASTAGRLERAVQGLRRMPSADVGRGERRPCAAVRGLVVGAGRVAGGPGAAESGGRVGVHRGRRPRRRRPAQRPGRLAGAVAAARGAAGGCAGGDRAQVVLHVEERALACTAETPEERAGDLCRLEDGPAVPSETARRLACDGELVIARPARLRGVADGDRPARLRGVVDGDRPARLQGGADSEGGAPGFDRALDYGRKRRVVPPPLRAALERRDRHCRFPGCERRHDLHAHHVRHWVHGGRTDRGNLVLLCRFHHRLVHEDGFTVEPARGGRLRFRRPDGHRIPHVHRLPAVPKGDRRVGMTRN